MSKYYDHRRMRGRRPTQNVSELAASLCAFALSDYGARNEPLVSPLSYGSEEPGSDKGVHRCLGLLHREARLFFDRWPDVGVKL